MGFFDLALETLDIGADSFMLVDKVFKLLLCLIQGGLKNVVFFVLLAYFVLQLALLVEKTVSFLNKFDFVVHVHFGALGWWLL